ncbi:hypothetical protein [Kribbella sp. NPDC051137]|uniref:hypothetical protein n=1 Tax=Kribbella sp. NPDC051137 TaxID=3155045 RepID=UPI0034338FCC
MPRKDSPETPVGLVRQIIHLLRGEPILLYGLGSVLVLVILAGAAAGAAAPTQVVQVLILSAVVLLIGALIAQTVVKRRPSEPPRDTVVDVTVDKIDAKGSTIGAINGGVTNAKATVHAGEIKSSGSTIGAITSSGTSKPQDPS